MDADGSGGKEELERKGNPEHQAEKDLFVPAPVINLFNSQIVLEPTSRSYPLNPAYFECR